MEVETIYRAATKGAPRGEGLSVGVVNGTQLVVVIQAEGKRRSVTLDKHGARKLADSILTELGPSSSELPECAPAEVVALALDEPLRAAFGRMTSGARDSLRHSNRTLDEVRRCVAEALAEAGPDVERALAVDAAVVRLQELAYEPSDHGRRPPR